MNLSDSEGSTVPNTPEDFSDVTNLNSKDAFALLRPISHSAQGAFNASVNTIIIRFNGNPAFEHYRHFLYAERGTARTSSVFTEDADGDVEMLGANAASEQWNGGFKFSLRERPHEEKSGWYLGTSRGHSYSPGQGIDILLAPPSKKWTRLGIAGIHARFYLHKESYRMIIQARHTVIVGKSGTMIRNSQLQVVDDKDLIVIGDCTYAFEYTSYFRSLDFEAELSQYIQRSSGPRWEINNLLSPTSVGAPVPLGEYYRSPSAFAQGTFGQVAAGWARDGAPVAIKSFKKPRPGEIELHKELMQIIGKHDNILHLLDCITNCQTQVPTAYCIYSPLAAMNLRELTNSYETNSAAQVALLKDFLTGLSHLHEKGIMHRDIKSENLAVTSIREPTGIILDLDAATTSQDSIDHTQGTVPYLAPEIISLKDWNPRNGPAPQPYEKSVDIWALGLSIIALSIGRHWSWKLFSHNDDNEFDRYSRARYGHFRNGTRQLKEKAKQPGTNSDPALAFLSDIVLDMTSLLPNNRRGASELLQQTQSAAGALIIDKSITPR